MRHGMQKKYFHLILWIIGIELIGVAIGQLTSTELSSWYRQLAKSPLTPPGYVFGIAWTILYALIAIAGWKIWSAAQTREILLAKIFFSIQLVLNFAWSPVFFNLHQIFFGFVLILLIILFTAFTILICAKRYKTVSVVLLPYLYWLVFAGYLNFYILFYYTKPVVSRACG